MSNTTNTTEAASAPQAEPAVVAPLEGGVRPVAYRLRDEEATEQYGRDLFVYWSPSEIRHKARGAAKLIALLEPLYDPATIDAAVAAERERWVTACCAAYADAMGRSGRERTAAADAVMAIRWACGA
jgi:hypothetical protein